MFTGPLSHSVSKGAQREWAHFWPIQQSHQPWWPEVNTLMPLRRLLQHCCSSIVIWCFSTWFEFLNFLTWLCVSEIMNISNVLDLPLCQCNPFPICPPSPFVPPFVFPGGCQHQPLYSCWVPVLHTVDDTPSLPASSWGPWWQPPQVIFFCNI